MDVGPVSLSEDLLNELVAAGAAAATIAVAGLDEAGSGPQLFGLERYLRSTGIAAPSLARHGYQLRHVGTALVAGKDAHELHFATASTTDLRSPGTFDPASSETRRRAAAINAGSNQPMLPGMPGPELRAVVHVVWTITAAAGLIAVQAGRILPSKRDGQVRWAELLPVPMATAPTVQPPAAVPAPGPDYHKQPEPALLLTPRHRHGQDAG